MPLLDVTQILTDPDLADSFAVKRRTQVIDAHGRTTTTDQLIPGVIGVVTAISPSDLDRREDYQAMSRSISVVTKFHLRGEVTGYQPDIVVWKGDNYLVKHVNNYPHFGPGFMEAECSSMDKTDLPFEPQAPGGLTFNQASNAIFATL